MYGTSDGQIGTLIPSDYGPLAPTFSSSLTVPGTDYSHLRHHPQNEPGYAPDTYPGMIFSASDDQNSFKTI